MQRYLAHFADVVPAGQSRTRRLDHISRQAARLERDQRITSETMALFVRFWLTIKPPIPQDEQAAAQAKGQERFDGFVETLGKRVQRGRWFVDEIVEDKNQRSLCFDAVCILLLKRDAWFGCTHTEKRASLSFAKLFGPV